MASERTTTETFSSHDERLHIREFVETDRDTLREIYLSSRRSTFTWLAANLFQFDDFDRQTSGELILVATLGEQTIGFSASWVPERFIHHLYLKNGWTGHGYGRALLDATVERIGRPARLKCLSMNRHALKFYRREGWIESGRGVSGSGNYLEMTLPSPTEVSRDRVPR
ncbi:hypothetical protein Pan216_28800 [Planctomycetes bacterium Pan216]|uniref:N-acetyltransferase domain-containing protein n=1 Tax=Kolteria novifilia TaxID=2527975 RepID=A0A518B4W6_9BACT|nr:hypothetical protein Pan216_28800 [Planctomycetes bacterium Pan216]